MSVGINRTVLDKNRFKIDLIVANKGMVKLKRKSLEAARHGGGGGGVRQKINTSF